MITIIVGNVALWPQEGYLQIDFDNDMEEGVLRALDPLRDRLVDPKSTQGFLYLRQEDNMLAWDRAAARALADHLDRNKGDLAEPFLTLRNTLRDKLGDWSPRGRPSR